MRSRETENSFGKDIGLIMTTLFFCGDTFLYLTINIMWITVKSIEERHVAYVSFVWNYMGNSEIFKELIGKLMTWAEPKGLLSKDTKLSSAYQDDPNVTPPDEMTLEVCMDIPENAEVTGDVKKKVMPGGKYDVLNTELTEPKEYWSAWMEVVNWTKENNIEIDISHPSYEFYLNNPEDHPEKHHIVDICLSIK